jgi:ribosomal protein L40E
MAEQKLIKFTCDRCGAKELRVADKEVVKTFISWTREVPGQDALVQTIGVCHRCNERIIDVILGRKEFDGEWKQEESD